MKKFIIGSALTLALLVLAGFSGCPWFQDPQEHIDGMGDAMKDLDKYEMMLGIDLAVADEDMDVDVDAETKIDMTSGSDPKLDATIALRGSAEGENFSASMDMVSVDKALYLKLNDLDIEGFDQFLDLDDVTDTHIKIDDESLSNFGVDLGPLEEAEQNISPEKIDKIKDLAANTSFFTFQEKLGKKEVNGVKTSGYKVELSKENTEKFIVDLAKVFDENVSSNEAEEALKDVDQLNGELWIGNDDNRLYEFTFTPVISNSDFEGASLSVSGQFNYDSNFSISAPSDSITIEEFMQKVLPPELIDGFMTGFEEGITEPTFDQGDLDLDLNGFDEMDTNGALERIDF